VTRLAIVLLVALVAIVSTRAYVVSRVTARVTEALARNETYAGTFDDVDVSLLRLSYTIENLRLVKRNGLIPVPFVSAPRVEYSVAWWPFLRGRPHGTTVFTNPTLNLVDGPSPELRQGPLGLDWRDAMRRLFPAKVNRIEIHGGELHLRNFHTKPEVDVYVDDVDIEVSNLTWQDGHVGEGVVLLRGSGVPMKHGTVRADFRLYPATPHPSFDCTWAVRDAELADWKSLLEAYVGLDAAAHTRIDIALRARNGELQGYARPVLRDVRTASVPEELAASNVLESLRDGLIGGMAALLEAPRGREISARIPISGTTADPEGDYWAAVRSLLANAFLESGD